jgi:predicted Zn-dependent peptidase
LVRTGKRIEIPSPGQQRGAGLAWVRPSGAHPDAAALDLIAAHLFSGGRSSPVESPLWRDGHVLSVETDSSFPGERFPSLLAVWAVVAPASDGDRVRKEIETAVGLLSERPLPAGSLDRARNALRLSLAARVQTRAGLAAALAQTAQIDGNWSRFLARLERLDTLTAEQIQAAARKYLSSGAAYSIAIEPAKEAQ